MPIVTEDDKKKLLQLEYPIGSYYYTNDLTKSPSNIIGGSWIQIKNTFLYPETSGVPSVENLNNNYVSYIQSTRTRTVPINALASHYHNGSHYHTANNTHTHSWSSSPSHTHSVSAHTHSSKSISSHTHTGWTLGWGWDSRHVAGQGEYLAGGKYWNSVVYQDVWPRTSIDINSKTGTTSNLTTSGSASTNGSGTMSGGGGYTSNAATITMQNYGSGQSFDILPLSKGCYLWLRVG